MRLSIVLLVSYCQVVLVLFNLDGLPLTIQMSSFVKVEKFYIDPTHVGWKIHFYIKGIYDEAIGY